MSSARVAIIGGGLSPSFAKTLREVSCDPARYHLVRDASTPEELLDGVEASARSCQLLVVMAGEWLRDEGLSLLIEIQQLRRNSRVLLVDANVESLALGHALRLGLRGLTDRDVDAPRLARVLDSIASGELWIGRQLLAEVIGLLAPADHCDRMDVWLNLPALTERERDVLKLVLDGKPNKSIATELTISEQTVKIHLQHVYRKLGVHRRVDLLKAFSGSMPAARSA
jgi:DNA-binding NarL/FixJ family response regulator